MTNATPRPIRVLEALGRAYARGLLATALLAAPLGLSWLALLTFGLLFGGH